MTNGCWVMNYLSRRNDFFLGRVGQDGLGWGLTISAVGSVDADKFFSAVTESAGMQSFMETMLVVSTHC